MQPLFDAFTADSPMVDPIMEIAEAYKKPVFIHCGHPPFSLSWQIGLLAERHPHVPTVMIHMGHGHGVYIEGSLNMAYKYDNLFLEVSGMPMGCQIKNAYETVGSERVMFGIDSPFHHPSVEIQRVYSCGLNDAQLEDVFYNNAKKFMELKTIGLTKKFGSKTAVNALNITLTNGVYGLLGANGAGKTTLMRLLCDIQTPTSGKITLDGKNISVLGEKYRNLLGYLPQQFGYYPDFTAWDFLMYVAALKGLSEKQAHKKATELLEAVDLAEKRNLKIKTFSGGMKQRLGIAQAMLNNPRILILDEPTAGLDPKERVRFRNLISAFSKDRIVILSTHIVSDVEFIAEDIIMMKDGQILHFGKTQEITTEIDGQVWECTVPTSRAEQYSETLNISNLRNIENNCTVLRVISEQSPMENAIKVEPTLEDLYLFYFKGVNE